MEKINTHKVSGNRLNTQLEVLKENSQHYEIKHPDVWVVLQFQKGDPDEGINGISNEALLAVLIDRIRDFQQSSFSCRENSLVLTKLEEAMHWLNHRTLDRLARGVEGTQEK